MIKFMVIAAPRSGTAWAANWLTNGSNHCIHDPLFDHHYGDLDSLELPGKDIGIACTGLALWPDWVNEHPATKVIVHRPSDEVNEACRKLGFPVVPPALFRGLKKLRGFHVNWTSLFIESHARDIQEHLVIDPFDAVRHQFLCGLNVTRDLKQLHQNPEVLAKLRAEGMPAIYNGTPDSRPSEPAPDSADAPGHQNPD